MTVCGLMTDASVSRGFDKDEDSPELSGWLDVLTDSGSDVLTFCCPADDDDDVHLSVLCEIKVFLCVLTVTSSRRLYLIVSVLLVQIKAGVCQGLDLSVRDLDRR